ncbi:MAG: TM2 domain-containing protein [Microcystis aeruginosa G11-04]|uniref:TM2 domain-containing protein n=1 Tax=Microcystis aeruginosa G11-04 TaxID=2685956 RepID=A0A966G0H5_MICAE|nr:TM2 domain-containing protein [Microcystis aeruginosa G11-04]
MSEKRILPALLLCFFFGMFGAHRFYVGKIGTGILQLVTLGGLGIWVLIDFIMIIVGAFTDKEGSSLLFMLNQQTRCQDNILLTQKFRKFLKP